jgi:hypothetical protein
MHFFWNTTPGHWNRVTEVSVVIAASFFRIKESNQVIPSNFDVETSLETMKEVELCEWKNLRFVLIFSLWYCRC